jgi:short-subunit dehydrogenase
MEIMTDYMKGKVILITGASSGFGADTARLFAKEGAIVILTARRVDKLKAIAEEICQAGGQAFVVPLDVTKQSQIDGAVHTVLDKFGQIDILLNNAGMGRLDWFETLDPRVDIDVQIDVNLRGVLQVTRAVLPSMLTNRAGTILNMSSVAGLIAAPMYSVYAATKYGMRGFTEALRRDVAPFGIHVCGIYPGPATTEFGQQSGENALKRNIKVPRWLYMTSEYVARRTVDLAHHPQRTLIIPWWFRFVIGFDTLFPDLVDWLLKVGFVKRFHQF